MKIGDAIEVNGIIGEVIAIEPPWVVVKVTNPTDGNPCTVKIRDGLLEDCQQ